jgi:hypothetical protein
MCGPLLSTFHNHYPTVPPALPASERAIYSGAAAVFSINIVMAAFALYAFCWDTETEEERGKGEGQKTQVSRALPTPATGPSLGEFATETVTKGGSKGKLAGKKTK